MSWHSPTITASLKANIPRKGDVQERQHARPRGLDHMAPEACQIGRPRRPGINQRRRRALPGDRLRIDADGGAAPIDMRVQVDEAGRDDAAAHIAHVAGFLGQGRVRPDLRNPSSRKSDIGHAVHAAAGIDHPPALQQQVVHGLLLLGVRVRLGRAAPPVRPGRSREASRPGPRQTYAVGRPSTDVLPAAGWP